MTTLVTPERDHDELAETDGLAAVAVAVAEVSAPDTGAPIDKIDGGVTRSLASTVGANLTTIALSVFTGVITARTLAPAGRGEVAAILAIVMLVSVAGSLGFSAGLSRVEALRPSAAREVVGAALLAVVVLGAASIELGELLLPLVFREQSADLIRTTRVLLLLILPVMLFESSNDLLVGRQQFGRMSLNRLLRPLVHAIGLTALWYFDRIDVTSVVVVIGFSYLLIGFGAYIGLIHESGIALPSVATIRESFSFGSRMFGGLVSQKGNHELDLMLMPALVAPEIIGVYVVAVSAAGIISGGFSYLRQLVFGIISRGESGDSMKIVEFTARLTLYAATFVALVLAALAPFLINVVYGSEFEGTVVALRFLLPGIVALVVAEVLFGALASLDRPLWATSASLIGLVATIIGVFTLVSPYGAAGAAVASTSAYAAMLLAALLFSRRLGFSARRLISPRRLVDDLATLRRHVTA